MDVGELLSYKPEKSAKKRPSRVPEHFERRPKVKKVTENDGETYQFKKILKKAPQKVAAEDERAARKQAVDVVQSIGKLADDKKEQLLALVENDNAEGEVIDEATIKKYLLGFEKKVTKNQEARIKFPDQPQKFMESEMELYEEIQKLHVLATVPEYYELVVSLNAVPTILGLLSHENSDISIGIVDLLQEMTDIDTLNESEDEANLLVDALLKNQLLTVLLQNLQRLDEKQKEDANAVHNTLGVIENISEFRPEVCSLAGQHGLLPWLLKRIKKKMFDSNKLYASEILAIMLQNDDENRQLLGDCNGVDNLLQALAVYKGHNPNNQEEIEFMENLFNCLCSALLHSPNKDLFLKGEGLQLMILMLRERKMSRPSALKVLAYSMTGEDGADNAIKFVDILGLRSLFPLFMKPPKGNRKSGHSKDKSEEHACSIVVSLFRHLSGNSRSRLIQKFVEDDHIKIDRLMELFFKYQRRVQDADARIEREKDLLEEEGEEITDEIEDEFYLKRLDAGLFVLQSIVCAILEVCCSGVQSIKPRVLTILGQHGGSTKQIKQIMREYAGHIGDSTTSETADIERRRLLSLVDRF